METSLKFVKRTKNEIEVCMWNGSNVITAKADENGLREIALAIELVKSIGVGSVSIVLQSDKEEVGGDE